MNDTILTFDTLSDYRFDSFVKGGQGEESPKLIGYGVNDPEVRTIPSSPPYEIKLYEAPQLTSPSNVEITVVSTGLKLLEVSKTSALSNNQYQVNYDAKGLGDVKFASNLKGLQVSIKYYGLGTINQKLAWLTKLQSQYTITVASTNSEIGSQEAADYIISTSQNASTVINLLISGLSNGGEIKFMEGTYNLETVINIVNNLKITGSGNSTEFKKNNTVFEANFFNFSNKTNCIFSNFYFNGNGKDGYAFNGTGSVNCKLQNIYVYNHNEYVFYYCENLSNCKVDRARGSNKTGFYQCNNLIRCESNDCQRAGFHLCNHLVNCYAELNDVYGFEDCDFLSNCKSYNNDQEGFYQCEHIIGSLADSNYLHGFDECNYITSSKAYNNGDEASNLWDGFHNCDSAVACKAENNYRYGFYGCNAIANNKSTGNGTANYNTSYSNWGGTLAAADTANGGFNG